MREAVQFIFKKLPTGVLNAILMITLMTVVYFVKTERATALGKVEQHDEHLARIDQQIAALAANVNTLVELEKQSRERWATTSQERARQAEQLGRAIALVEAHVQAAHKSGIQ